MKEGRESQQQKRTPGKNRKRKKSKRHGASGATQRLYSVTHAQTVATGENRRGGDHDTCEHWVGGKKVLIQRCSKKVLKKEAAAAKAFHTGNERGTHAQEMKNLVRSPL